MADPGDEGSGVMGAMDAWRAIYGAAYRLVFPILDADFVSGAAGLDSEISKDGAAFVNCVNEATEIGSSGVYYLDLTYNEMFCTHAVIQIKTSTSGAKTVFREIKPERLILLEGGTAQGGASDSITLASAATDQNQTYVGCVLWIVDGTGIGQARLISSYVGSSRVATVTPAWTTAPGSDSEYIICCDSGAMVSAWGGSPVLGDHNNGYAYPLVDLRRLNGAAATINALEDYLDGTDYMPVNVAEIAEGDPTDQIRDSVVDDAMRIDASALNTLAGHDPGSQIAAQSDITGLSIPSAVEIAGEVGTELSDDFTAVLAAISNVTGALLPDFNPAILDDFNRSDEVPPMTGWADLVNGLAVISNECAASVGGSVSYYSTAVGEYQVLDAALTLTTLPDDGNTVVLALMDSGFSDGYQLTVGRDDGDADLVNLRPGGGGTSIEAEIDLSAGDAFGFRIGAGRVWLYYKPAGAGVWRLLDSASDAAPVTVAYVVAGLDDTTARVDDLRLQTFDAANAAGTVWQRIIEGGLTAEQMLRILFAANAGMSRGGGTKRMQFFGVDDETVRLEGEMDAAGNRVEILTRNGD